jgi:hypothetical protein
MIGEGGDGKPMDFPTSLGHAPGRNSKPSFSSIERKIIILRHLRMVVEMYERLRIKRISVNTLSGTPGD